MKIKDFISLIRVRQWYKNLVIFLPLIFGMQLFNLFSIKQTFIGFFSLCFISSANYIINDIKDRKSDKENPEKKHRPIASGSVRPFIALLLMIIFLFSGLYAASTLSFVFALFALSLFLLTQIYSFFLKKHAFADILIISVNFVLRAISGAFVIADGFEPYIRVSSWLILCPFFLALFLATSKRQAEAILLKGNSKNHRPVLDFYTKEITSALIIISTTLLIASYSLYVFFSPYPNLIFTLPFVLYVIFKFFYFAEKGQKIARHPHLVYKDIGIVISGMIIAAMAFVSIYL